MSAIVLPTDKASMRTRNRLIEAGPEFNIGREMPVVYFGGEGVNARLLHSIRNDWVGWVPADEIRLVTRL